MGIDKKCDESDFYMAPYSIVDVVTIFSIFIVGSIGSLVIYVLLVSDQNIQFLLYSYTTSILSICAPYFWLKKKYKITFVGLGLKKGKYHLPNQLLIATIIAFVLFIVAKIAIPTIDKAELIKTELRAESFFAIILVPFTLRGFARFILNPIGEELLFRGFLYGYFRKKLNLKLAIISQAIISTIWHINYIKEALFHPSYLIQLGYIVLIFVILACIYEATKSLYPCIVCHGMYNFLLLVSSIYF